MIHFDRQLQYNEMIFGTSVAFWRGSCQRLESSCNASSDRPRACLLRSQSELKVSGGIQSTQFEGVVWRALHPIGVGGSFLLLLQCFADSPFILHPFPALVDRRAIH